MCGETKDGRKKKKKAKKDGKKRGEEDGKEDVTEIEKFFKLLRKSRNELGVCFAGETSERARACVGAFVREPQSQSQRVTDNSTQGMLYD